MISSFNLMQGKKRKENTIRIQSVKFLILKRHWKETLWQNDHPSLLQDCSIWLLYSISAATLHWQGCFHFYLVKKWVTDWVTDWLSDQGKDQDKIRVSNLSIFTYFLPADWQEKCNLYLLASCDLFADLSCWPTITVLTPSFYSVNWNMNGGEEVLKYPWS